MNPRVMWDSTRKDDHGAFLDRYRRRAMAKFGIWMVLKKDKANMFIFFQAFLRLIPVQWLYENSIMSYGRRK
jgi:hypothetical protein